MAAEIPIVRDLTIPLERYPHLNENQTLHDAALILQTFTCGENDRLRYGELLVLNDRNQLVGRISIQDILKCLDSRLSEIPHVKKFEGKGSDFPNLTFLWEDSFFEGCARHGAKAIKDCTSPIKILIKGSDPILKALSIMLSTKDVTLPVIDENRVIGVIRLEEIFEAISSRCNP